MSAPNGYPGPQGWPANAAGATPADAYDPRQPGGHAPVWPPQQAAAQQGQPTQGRPAQGHAPQGQWSPPAGAGYGQQQGYAQPSAQSTLAAALSQGRGAGQSYVQPAYAPPQPPNYGAAADPYAPQFEPYVPAQTQRTAGQPAAPSQPPAYAPYATQPGYGAGQSVPREYPMSQWPLAAPAAARDYDIGSYMPPQAPQGGSRAAERPAAEPALSDWGQPGDPYAQPPTDELGFAQAAGGELDPAYGEDDQGYEYEEAPRRRRPMMILGALAGAVLVGGGIAYGYKAILGDAGNGQPPVVRSASEPSKTKPADAGGKQFAHSDSKIMGRLGEGAATSISASTEADASGTRKVATLVVGRDGSIQPPPAAASDGAADTGVPGLTVVDALGPQTAKPDAAPATPAAPQVVNAASNPAPAPQKVVVSPPVTAPQPPPQATGSVGDAAEAPPAPKPPPAAKPKKIAALAPAAAATAAAPAAAQAAPSPSGASGYVAVLASVPASSSSRMDALKRYADMQQKYGPLLTGKTPDVAEANLGAKGNYHRLVVGPPASREQASSLCTQLKSQGYNDCWVTPY